MPAAAAQPPPPVRLDPMTEGELADWGPRSIAGFADQQVAAGLLAWSEAADRARSVFAHELPDGLASAGQHLWTVRADLPAGPHVVGHLWLRVRPDAAGEVEAYVMDVDVEEPWRGRGLGTATLRAAEDAAAGLGAAVARLQVFSHNRPAVRLYDRSGYEVVASTMTKTLDGPAPVPGTGLELRDMSEREYAAFRVHLEADHGVDLPPSGAVPPQQGARRAAADLDRLLPDGPATSGHRLWTAYDGPAPAGRPVGHAWVALQHRADGPHAFGCDLEVRPEVRGRGTGRSLVAAAERELRDLGVRSVGLSVPGSHAGARALYEQAGFQVRAQARAKVLT